MFASDIEMPLNVTWDSMMMLFLVIELDLQKEQSGRRQSATGRVEKERRD